MGSGAMEQSSERRLLPHADAAMERHACGDDAAFAVVFDAISPYIVRYARRILRDEAAADDIAQQTLLKMNRARGDFMPGSQVLPWAYTIAHNVIFDQLRQMKREGQLMQRAGLALVPAFASAPDEQLLAGETASALDEMLAALPEAQRAAYLLMQREGLTLAQAASRLGTTITAVKLRVHRAVTRLRAVFADGKGLR